MASCRFPPWPILCRVLSRALGWLTSLIAIVVLSFLASQWSDLSGAAVSGILGATVSLITDSWQIVALTSGGSDFPILSPTRATFHDLVSLCVCVGGGVLIRLAKLQETDEIDAGEPLADSSPVRPYYSRQAMLMACMWTLASVMIWRSLFVVWAAVDYMLHLYGTVLSQRIRRRNMRDPGPD